MFRRLLLSSVFIALSPVLPGAGDARSAAASALDGPGTPAVFAWGDIDGDGKLELAAVSADGALQLLAGSVEDRFEDVSERVGLAGITDAALALWVDYDADGRLDLFVGARSGASRLFRNEGGLFVDMTAGAGLATEGEVRSADWLDHDGDGRADLHVVTAKSHELYRGLEGGFFERAELPLVSANAALNGVVVTEVAPPSAPDRPSDEAGSPGGSSLPRSVDGARASGNRVPLGPSPSFGGATPVVLLPGGCASSIQDQSSPGACLGASATPALGKLYPLSTNLFVAVGGNVGIGTTSPSAKLHVAGTARITNTLTLAPSLDMALDVNVGSIYKSGLLFIHTRGASNNTAIGRNALSAVTMGTDNTASGADALQDNEIGQKNTAHGSRALFSNTNGFGNTAIGSESLYSNISGTENTASGNGALRSNTSGAWNTASGAMALFSNTTGLRNTASGHRVLSYNTTGSYNTASGTYALRFNTTGYANTAIGAGALFKNLTGENNTAIGSYALYFNTTGARNIGLGKYGGTLSTGDDNIAIGNQGVLGEDATIRIGTAATHTRAFVAGIRGVTTANADAIPVVVDSAGQLGTVSSSRRFKQDIADMGDRTERLLELRPVVFRYREQQTLPDGSEVPLEYGLIAEEVAEVFPDLVVRDEEGKPFTVKYHLLSAMLLNELQELHEQQVEQAAELTRLRRLEARVDALESRSAGDVR